MGRTFQLYYASHNPVAYSVNRPVDGAGTAPENRVGENQNYLAAKKLVPLVTHAWHEWISSYTAADGATYWTLGSWRTRVRKDFDTVTCVVRVKNLNDTNTGRVRFKVASSGAVAYITVAAAAAEATATVDLTIDPAQVTDTIEVAVLDPTAGDGGKLWLQSVTIYTKAHTSPLDGDIMLSGYTPIDSTETQAEAPLTSYLRSTQFANLDAIYKKRVPGTVVTFSGHYDERDNNDWLYRTTSTNYQTIARLPCPIPAGISRLGIAVQGWGGAGAKFKITSQAGGSKEVEIDGAWTYGDPNTGLWNTYASSVVVTPGAVNEAVDLMIKTTAGTAYLSALCVWMEEPT